MAPLENINGLFENVKKKKKKKKNNHMFNWRTPSRSYRLCFKMVITWTIKLFDSQFRGYNAQLYTGVNSWSAIYNRRK